MTRRRTRRRQRNLFRTSTRATRHPGFERYETSTGYGYRRTGSSSAPPRTTPPRTRSKKTRGEASGVIHWKGHTVRKQGDYWVTDVDPESHFESAAQAKRFISHPLQRNLRRNPDLRPGRRFYHKHWLDYDNEPGLFEITSVRGGTVYYASVDRSGGLTSGRKWKNSLEKFYEDSLLRWENPYHAPIRSTARAALKAYETGTSKAYEWTAGLPVKFAHSILDNPTPEELQESYEEHLGLTTSPEFEEAGPEEQAAMMTGMDMSELLDHGPGCGCPQHNPARSSGIYSRTYYLVVGKQLSLTPPVEEGGGSLAVKGPYKLLTKGTPVRVIGRGRGGHRVLIKATYYGQEAWGWVDWDDLTEDDPLQENPRIGSKDPGAMTPGEVNRELAIIDKLDREFTDEMIRAGRGNERFSDWSGKDDALSQKGMALWHRRMALRNEVERQMGPGHYRFPEGWRKSRRNPGEQDLPDRTAYVGPLRRDGKHSVQLVYPLSGRRLTKLMTPAQIEQLKAEGYRVYASRHNPDDRYKTAADWKKEFYRQGHDAGKKDKGQQYPMYADGSRVHGQGEFMASKLVDFYGVPQSKAHDIAMAFVQGYFDGLGGKRRRKLNAMPRGRKWEYVVLVRERGKKRWKDSGEGPWDTHEDAEQFARAEVGAEWQVKKKSIRLIRPNPEGAAESMFESFHGYAPEKDSIIEEEEHYHEYLATLGDLRALEIVTPTNLRVELGFEGKNGVGMPILASNEEGTQLYIEGGDQEIDLHGLKMDGKKWTKEHMVLGDIETITYDTEKSFDKREPVSYYHHFTEDEPGQPLPELVYDTINQKLSIVGGKYFIKKPLVGVSPGIEN